MQKRLMLKTTPRGSSAGSIWIYLCCFFVSSFLFAETPLEKPLPNEFNWVFSGMVSNEAGNRYGYYFEVQRHQEKFHILSALVNIEDKALVFVEEDSADIKEAADLNWQVGHAYLGLNRDTHHFVFGIKTPKKRGFKFNIDTLSEPTYLNHPQALAADLALNVNQMGRLNGYLYLGKKQPELFVSAKQVWFRQLHAEANHASHELTNVLCQFDDGSGFYAVHLPEPHALRGFVAGWRDAEGKPKKMSQFVNIKQNVPHEWDLSAPFPLFHLHFSDLLAQNTVPIAAGVIDNGERGGFCTAVKASV